MLVDKILCNILMKCMALTLGLGFWGFGSEGKKFSSRKHIFHAIWGTVKSSGFEKNLGLVGPLYEVIFIVRSPSMAVLTNNETAILTQTRAAVNNSNTNSTHTLGLRYEDRETTVTSWKQVRFERLAIHILDAMWRHDARIDFMWEQNWITIAKPSDTGPTPTLVVITTWLPWKPTRLHAALRTWSSRLPG